MVVEPRSVLQKKRGPSQKWGSGGGGQHTSGAVRRNAPALAEAFQLRRRHWRPGHLSRRGPRGAGAAGGDKPTLLALGRQLRVPGRSLLAGKPGGLHPYGNGGVNLALQAGLQQR
jgi:hypothetical protein